MTKIGCNVNNCSYNKSNTCYSGVVTIGGSSDCSTSCSSFLDEMTYSDLTNSTDESGPCDALVCSVDTCAYNEKIGRAHVRTTVTAH